MLKKKKNNKGFTLVELLVVIAIIGILAVVAVPALFKNIEKGKIADLESDISAIRSAVLSKYADNSTYPIADGTTTTIEDVLEDELEGLSKPFRGTYKLRRMYISNDGKTYTSSRVITPGSESKGEVLQLVIDSNMKTISTSGVEKLKQDLGDKFTTLLKTGQPASNTEATEVVVNLIVNMY